MSTSESCVIGIIDCIILEPFNRPMTLLTWFLTFEILWDFYISFADICNFPWVKSGTVSVAPHVANSSSIVNPLFARTVSPCCNFSKILFLTVSSLSDTLLPQLCERKLTAPPGAIPIKYLMVWWCLQLEQVWARAVKPNGLSINTLMKYLTWFLTLEICENIIFLLLTFSIFL